MTREKIIERIKNKFPGRILNFSDKSNKRVYIDIKSEDIRGFAELIFKELGARFNIASAVDTPNAIEILYHFTFDEINLLTSVRVYLNRKDPHIQSVVPVIKGAEWIEREIHELFGVEFEGHPDLRPLLLPDDWPKGKHPLRRDCQL